MLSALFSGAYYDVLQVETADGALEVARRDRPGLIVISDRLPGRGAAGLCEALRHDPATAETARIVMTDLPDPARTAMLIHAGAEEVIARSCRDDEVLARVRKLVDHRARLSALNLRDGPQGTQPGLREPAAEFGRMAQIALIAAAETAEQWASQIRGAADPGLQLRLTCLPPETTASAGGDVVIVDSRTLGTDGTLRVVARMARRSDPARGQILVAIPEEDAALGVRALDLGADSVMTLPLHPAEAVARITLLLRRKAEFTSLHARLRSGLRSAVTDPLTGLANLSSFVEESAGRLIAAEPYLRRSIPALIIIFLIVVAAARTMSLLAWRDDVERSARMTLGLGAAQAGAYAAQVKRRPGNAQQSLTAQYLHRPMWSAGSPLSHNFAHRPPSMRPPAEMHYVRLSAPTGLSNTRSRPHHRSPARPRDTLKSHSASTEPSDDPGVSLLRLLQKYQPSKRSPDRSIGTVGRTLAAPALTRNGQG